MNIEKIYKNKTYLDIARYHTKLIRSDKKIDDKIINKSKELLKKKRIEERKIFLKDSFKERKQQRENNKKTYLDITKKLIIKEIRQ